MSLYYLSKELKKKSLKHFSFLSWALKFVQVTMRKEGSFREERAEQSNTLYPLQHTILKMSTAWSAGCNRKTMPLHTARP
jgi:hypothetical protein